jgi:hypothetical protein
MMAAATRGSAHGRHHDDPGGRFRRVSTVVSGLGGYSISGRIAGRNEAARDIRAAQREQANRAADAAERRQEQRHDWQRQVLLDLQDELQRLARVTGRSLLQDAKTVREQGKLGLVCGPCGTELSPNAKSYNQSAVPSYRVRWTGLSPHLAAALPDFLLPCGSNLLGTSVLSARNGIASRSPLVVPAVTGLGDLRLTHESTRRG